ncbi:hypothetical protein [Streptomyces sp. NPDC005322]|uniref:hypothetical protein n=1 Tax=unclassified Streptomyces TaxID=2593676 RepID=UPI0033A6004E
MFKSGVGFFALFGLGWWLMGASAFGGWVWLVVIAAGCAVTVGLMLAARRVLQAPAGGPLPVDRRRRFHQINGLQWLLIVAIAVVCGRAGVPVLIPPMVALIVGLHFLPLAAVFAQPRLRIPAALLIAAGAVGLTVWLADGPDRAVPLVVGLSSALALWGTAGWTVMGVASAVNSPADADR